MDTVFLHMQCKARYVLPKSQGPFRIRLAGPMMRILNASVLVLAFSDRDYFILSSGMTAEL
jgi:hypothetical protein